MRRRDFIKGITASTTWPVVARAQQTAKMYRIALAHPSASIAEMSESGGNSNYAALFKELRRLGYIEGVNLVVTRYSGEGQEERFPELCREVVRTKPDVIVTASTRPRPTRSPLLAPWVIPFHLALWPISLGQKETSPE